MRLLDLFCGAGGAGMGYHRAGFEVVGVDINPQPHYPFEFHRADALEFCAAHWSEFDVIHASPPCQHYTKASKQWRLSGIEYPDLIAETRAALQTTGKPYIIENVPDSPLINPLWLNGWHFGLLVHRLRGFESSLSVYAPSIELPSDWKPVKMGRPINDGDIICPVGHFSGVAYARQQMGIDWMTRDELSQSIPPAYTEWLGRQIITRLRPNTASSLTALAASDGDDQAIPAQRLKHGR